MCAVKSPKVQQSTTTTPKPTIIRNTYLDGTDPALRSAREGVSALRIDLGSAKITAPKTAASAAPGRAVNLDPTTDAFGRPLSPLGSAMKQVVIKKGWAPR